MAIHKVQPAGDWELWLVYGTLTDGFEWRLPVKALPWKSPETNDQFYCVPSQSYSNANEYAALSGVLDPWDRRPEDTKNWWFDETTFNRVAVKAPGITPDYYKRWPGYEYRFDQENEELCFEAEPGLSHNSTIFLRRVHRMSGEVNYPTLVLLWRTINQCALTWLTRDQKTLDLGFVKLIPTPYRWNWKELLAVLHRQIIYAFRKNEPNRKETLDKADFYRSLAKPEMLAIDRGKHFIHWSIEVLPSEMLNKRMIEHEYARKQNMGAVEYATHILKQMHKRFRETMEIVTHYMQSILLPPAKAIDGHQLGSTILVPKTGETVIRPKLGVNKEIEVNPTDPFVQFHVEQEPKPNRKGPKLIEQLMGLKLIPEEGESKLISRNGQIIDIK